MAKKPYRDPTSTHIEDWHWRPYEDVHAELGLKDIPDYIQKGFGEFMNEQAGRAKQGAMTPRDLIKAYTIAQSSIGRGGLSHATASKMGMKLPNTGGEVRPEGAFAEWLGSPEGQRYLDLAQKGEVDPAVIADLQYKFSPFGKQNDQATKMVEAAHTMPAMAGDLNRVLVGSPEEYRDFAEKLKGIAGAKTGFIGSLLGRGDLPTLDARQLNLHTRGAPVGIGSIMARGKGKGAREAVDRLAARQKAMGLDIDPALAPHYQHLAHHAVWDKTAGANTTHEDLIRAMRGYADGGPVTPKEKALAMMAASRAKALQQQAVTQQYQRAVGNHLPSQQIPQPQWMAQQGIPKLAGGTIGATEREAAGRAAAKMIKAQPQVKASEALGQLMEKGMKKVTTTQADRTRVGGGNIGGAAFPAISAADPSYTGKAWGVMDEGTAKRLTNLTDPTTVWTTMLGSANQLKTNPVVFDKLMRQFVSSMKQGNLSPELAAKINHNLALTFGEGADIRDPKIWKQADTFEKRAALADLMMGQGVTPQKGGIALGGEKSGKGVIFKPTETLIKETEPTLRHTEHGGTTPTFAAGPRLFKLEKQTSYRPDLHPGFPTLIHGEDLGHNMAPVPTEVFLPDFHARFKAEKKRTPGYYDLALGVKGEGLPSQDLHDAYIRHLLREGHAEGGAVNNPTQDEMLAHVILRKADGGSIDIKQVGAEEAPDMPVKEYMKPAGEMGLPVGGVDFQPEQPGKQLMPGAPNQPPGQIPGQPGQIPQQPAPLTGQPTPSLSGPKAPVLNQPNQMLGNPPMPPFGQPRGPQSNILSMTPQGQAMQAMRPNPTPMPRMARGGAVRMAGGGASTTTDQKQPIGIDALGDSTTYGWNHGQQSSKNMISTAQDLFGDNVKINNLGVPSTTLGDLMATDTFKNVLTNNNPVVILNYGMNEAYRGEDPETFRSNLMAAVQQLQDAGKKVILQTPNKPNSSEGWEGSVGNYANIISDVANQTKSALDDKYSTPVTYAEDDTIHPDESGYGVLGKNLYSTINSVLNPTTQNAGTSTTDTTATKPMSVEDLYYKVLGRAPDAEGLAYWKQQFGNEVDPNEASVFTGTAQNLLNQNPNTYASMAPNLTAQQMPQSAALPATPDVSNQVSSAITSPLDVVSSNTGFGDYQPLSQAAQPMAQADIQPMQYNDVQPIPEPDASPRSLRMQNKFEGPSLAYQPEQYMFAKGGSTTPSVSAMRHELAKKRATTHSIKLEERAL